MMRAVTLTLLLCLLTIHPPPNFCTAHSDSNSEVRCIESERHALLNFKQHLTDPSNRLASWAASASDVDCCHWLGVVCHNRTGHVLQLRLRSHYPLYDPELTTVEQWQAQYERSVLGDHGQGRQRVPSERTICNQRKLEKEGLDEVRFMVDVNLMGISNMLKEAFPTMKNWRDCKSFPPRPVRVIVLYCAARLRRLYKSLKFTHGCGKYTPKTITESTVTEVREGLEPCHGEEAASGWSKFASAYLFDW